MKHLYFVRHGRSVMNDKGLYSSQSETPLTDLGEQQCVAAGQKLLDEGVKIDCIVASPLKRTLDSATIIATEIGFDPSKIILNDLFIERGFGPLEGTSIKSGANLDTTSGVEHSSDLVARVKLGLEFLNGLEADTILVVAHGAVGRALHHLTQPDVPYHVSPKLDNAQVITLL